MSTKSILAFDIGTSSAKVSVFSEGGNAAASASRPYETLHPHAGYAEQRPDDWWEAIRACLKEISEKNPGLLDTVEAAGVCGHMLGCLPVDETGRHLTNCMIHSDSRSGAQYERISRLVGRERLYHMSGNVLDARSPLSKYLWLKEELPQIYGRTAKILQSKDYITARLTGNIDTTDWSDAAHAELMNIRTGAYEDDLYRELGLAMEKLPRIHAGMDLVGAITKQAAADLGLKEGIPVIAGGGDGSCSNLGSGNVHPGDISCSLGTTAYFTGMLTQPYIDPGQRLFNIMGMDGKSSALCGAIQSGCASLNWAMDLANIEDIERLNELAASVPAGSDGLIFVPYLDGERSPLFDAKARGMFFGLSAVHGTAHLARSVFEGITFGLAQVLEAFREAMPVKEITLIGGGAKSALWRQMLADVWHCPVTIMKGAGDDSNGFGIAVAAGTAIGLYESFEQAVGVKETEKRNEPDPDAGAYEKNYQIYCRLYPQTKELMHQLA